MRMPDIIVEIIAKEKIFGIKKSDTVKSYLQAAGFISLLIETSGQYAELLIRDYYKSITKELLLACVKDVEIISEYRGNDLMFEISLDSCLKNIYKSFFKVFSDDVIIATGCLIHINDD